MAAIECAALNCNAQPEGPSSALDMCRYTVGYSAPLALTIIVGGVFTGYVASFIQVFVHHHNSWWRILVGSLFLAIGVCFFVYWAIVFYRVMFTSPGYVSRSIWQYPPQCPSYTPRRSISRGDDDDDEAEEEEARRHASGDSDYYSSANRETSDPYDYSAQSGPTPRAVSAGIGDANQHPVNWNRERSERSQNPYSAFTLDPDGGLRHCGNCELYKPDRAHHCKVCNRCVYMYDHHCPWINNCIGRNNYKLFACFVLVSTICLVTAGTLMLIGLFGLDGRHHDINFSLIYRLVVAVFALLFGFVLFIFGSQMCCMYGRGVSSVDVFVTNEKQKMEETSMKMNCSSATACGMGSMKYPHPETEEQREARIQRHHEELLGAKREWWQLLIPVAVPHTDDDDDDRPNHHAVNVERRREQPQQVQVPVKLTAEVLQSASAPAPRASVALHREEAVEEAPREAFVLTRKQNNLANEVKKSREKDDDASRDDDDDDEEEAVDRDEAMRMRLWEATKGRRTRRPLEG